MNIEVIKYDLVNKLLSTTDEDLLVQLVALFKKSGIKSEPVSIAQYNKELKASETLINNGNFTSFEDIESESEEW